MPRNLPQYSSCSSLRSSQSNCPSQKFSIGTHVDPSEQHLSDFGQLQPSPGPEATFTELETPEFPSSTFVKLR